MARREPATGSRRQAALRRDTLPEPASRAGPRRGIPGQEFFDARDLVQVKYEMVRRVKADGAPVTAAAAAFGYSRPSYYEAAAALERSGLEGLVPARPGPRGAHKLTEEILRLGRAAAAPPTPRCGPRPWPGRSRRTSACARTPAHRACPGPLPGAPLQKPLTCPPARRGRRSTRPRPCHLRLATRLLNRAPARMPARIAAPGTGLDARYEQLRHAALHARAEAFPLGLGVLTGQGVTAWRRALAELVPAATPARQPPPRRPAAAQATARAADPSPPSSSTSWPASRSPAAVTRRALVQRTAKRPEESRAPRHRLLQGDCRPPAPGRRLPVRPPVHASSRSSHNTESTLRQYDLRGARDRVRLEQPSRSS